MLVVKEPAVAEADECVALAIVRKMGEPNPLGTEQTRTLVREMEVAEPDVLGNCGSDGGSVGGVGKGDNWGTPKWLFDKLNRIYNFSLDAAANLTNHKCSRWFGPGGEREDALADPWPTDVNIFCNPPYSRGLQRRFVERAKECGDNGGLVVMLLPADTSTKLFHDLVLPAGPQFIRGRVRFEGAPAAAKFGSLIVVYK